MDNESFGIRADSQTKFLMELGVSPEVIGHANGLLKNARRMLSLHLPDVVPVQPSIIIPTRGDEYGGGEYLGMFNGSHYLEVGFGKKPEVMSDRKREVLELVTIHELVHQRQMEVPEIAQAIPYVSAALTTAEITQASPHRIIDFLRTQSAGRQISDLQLALTEGQAWQTVFFILLEKIEEAKNTGDQAKVDLLTAVLQDQRDVLKSLESNESDEVVNGSRIILTLAERYNFKNIFQIMRMIDWHKCGRIRIGTQEYASLILDPTQLPGLHKNQSTLF